MAVLVVGTVLTYLVVPQPTGSGTVAGGSAWSAALGFFAAVPIAYLVMVVAMQVIRPAPRLTTGHRNRRRIGEGLDSTGTILR